MTLVIDVSSLTQEQRLIRCVVEVMGKVPAIAGIMMVGKREVSYNEAEVPTACTNGRDEWYGSTFLTPLRMPQIRFLVLHENYHKMYRHLKTWAHLWRIDAHLANIAMDHDINIKIMDEYGQDGWVEFIKGGCLNYDYRGWGTAKIFWHLHKKKKDNPQGGNGNPEDGDGEPLDEHDFEGAQEMDAEEKRELEREIDEAIRQGDIVAGKTGSGGSRDAQELLEPKVDWREVLRDFIQNQCKGSDFSSYRRPNRRYLQSGEYRPSGVSEKVEELCINNDMSGSIGNREISVVLTECKSCFDTVHPDKVRVLYWDTKVCADEEYTMDQLDSFVKSTKPKGGGGTDVTCVPRYMIDNDIKPQASIVFTDGYLYGGWGTWDHPVLWVILDNKSAKPDVGITIHVSSEDMR